MRISQVLFFVTTLVLSFWPVLSLASSPTRIFKATEGQEIIFMQKSLNHPSRFVFLLKNSQLPENNKPFLFLESNKRWSPANKSIQLAFTESDRTTLVGGTVKKILTLAGASKDLSFYEVEKIKDEVPNLEKLYSDEEGQKYPPETNLTAKSQEVMKQRCNVDLVVFVDKTFLVSKLKTLVAMEGLADLCADQDYKKAIQALKKVEFKSTATNETPKISLSKTTLVIDLGKSSENTFHHIKFLASKAL